MPAPPLLRAFYLGTRQRREMALLVCHCPQMRERAVNVPFATAALPVAVVVQVELIAIELANEHIIALLLWKPDPDMVSVKQRRASLEF